MKKLLKIVAKKNDWDDFSAKEQLITENTVILVSLLFEMCHTQLQKKSINSDTVVPVDTQRVEELASRADDALAEADEQTAFVDFFTVHESILNYKSFISISGNNINHPDDWLIRVYAQNILAAIIE